MGFFDTFTDMLEAALPWGEARAEAAEPEEKEDEKDAGEESKEEEESKDDEPEEEEEEEDEPETEDPKEKFEEGECIFFSISFRTEEDDRFHRTNQRDAGG